MDSYIDVKSAVYALSGLTESRLRALGSLAYPLRKLNVEFLSSFLPISHTEQPLRRI